MFVCLKKDITIQYSFYSNREIEKLTFFLIYLVLDGTPSCSIRVQVVQRVLYSAIHHDVYQSMLAWSKHEVSMAFFWPIAL